MRNPSSRPCTAGIPPCPPGRARASSSNTVAEAPWPTSRTSDVHRAQVLGSIAEKAGIVPFMQLAAQMMRTEPYASTRRVFWVVDNDSSHNGARFVARMDAAWPTVTLVHLPVHASWLNQMEIYFSILHCKTISCAGFPDLDPLAHRVMAFQEYYSTMAEPFDWNYTRHDLNDYLRRLAVREPMFAA